MAKRILLVSDSYLPTVSGVTTVVHEYVHSLTKAGYTVTVLAPQIGTVSNETCIGVPGPRNPFRTDTIVPIPFFGISHKVAAFSPEVIHIHSPGPLGIWARWWAQKNNVPVVTTVHGTPDFSASYLPFPYLTKKIARTIGWAFWKWFLRSSQNIVAPSYFIVEALKKIGYSKNVVRIPFWIRSYNRKRTTSKKNTQKVQFLFFGRLDPDKNLPFLIESWAQTTTSEKQLTIAGRSLEGQKESLLELAKKHNCLHSITILGTVSEKQKEALFEKTDFFVMPSKVEVQSIVTLQAALSGTPVLAANASALPEIVLHSSCPELLFNPTNTQDLAAKIDYCVQHSSSIGPTYTLSKKFAQSFTEPYALKLLKSIY